jgi:hypothetical protein
MFASLSRTLCGEEGKIKNVEKKKKKNKEVVPLKKVDLLFRYLLFFIIYLFIFFFAVTVRLFPT